MSWHFGQLGSLHTVTALVVEQMPMSVSTCNLAYG